MRLLVAWIKKKICRQLLHFFVEQTKQQNVDFNGIRTQIVRVEGKHADHLTTTWARLQVHIMIGSYPLSSTYWCSIMIFSA